MAVLRITKFPEKVLKTKTKKISGWTQDLTRLVGDMFDTMYAVNGVGLAANQIGLSMQLAVIDVKPNGRSKRIVLINPKLIDNGGKLVESEGCLSLPGLFKKISRPDTVKVMTFNEKGIPWEIKGTGLLARALQHEIDHLEGKVFVDHLPFMQKLQVQKEIKQYQPVWENQTIK
ncbi:MAG: peptide deformylase [Elusimicrobiota bacterium]